MYFGNSYPRVFVGTQLTADNSNANLSDGFIISAGLSTQVLVQTSATVNSNYGVGTFGFFNKDTYLSVDEDAVDGQCCPLILASASPYSSDSISPTIGGIQESVKSKYINPKLISEFYRVDPCTPQQEVLHIGNTNYTTTTSPLNTACDFTFYCGETYTLRIDIKGSPALRFLNHNIERMVASNPVCCPDPTPSIIDGTLVMIDWANFIVTDPILMNFISPIVYDEAGLPWYAPGTVGAPRTWDNYSSPGHTADTYAGLRLLGAYMDTVFGNCTFQTTDYFEKEPIKIYASMVDFVGDPCTFTGICTVEECPPLQGAGFGENVLRELILSEGYRQQFFATDLRIREITEGSQLLDVIDRSSSYYRYVIVHNVPRKYNPTSIYDNDQYRLEIITSGVNTAFESFMDTWLTGCGDGCTTLQTFGCTPCTPLTP